METSDVPGVGGPALHPNFQWDGPAWGVFTKVSGRGYTPGPTAGGVARPAFHCPTLGGAFTILVTIGLYLYYEGFPADGGEMCLRPGPHFLIL